MKHLSKIKVNQRITGALALFFVLGVPLAVYAGHKEASKLPRARSGADAAVRCTLLCDNNPKMIPGCITGICDSLHPVKKDPVGFRRCMANANRKLKE